MARILLLDDSTSDAATVAQVLKGRGNVELVHVAQADHALQTIQQDPPALLMVDPAVAEIFDGCFYQRTRDLAPHTPILIVSDRGQEEQAVRALRRGAASFVPKHLMHDYLWDTIQSVLQVARQELCQLRMLEQMTELRCAFEIENDPQLVAPLVSYVQEHMRRLRLCEPSELTRVGIAIHEALTNAVYHGNLELDSSLKESPTSFTAVAEKRRVLAPYRDRRVNVELLLSPQRARISIRDHGPGFDHQSLPDPTDVENVDKISGRGIFLIRTFMDRVRFQRGGREIVMWKRKQKQTDDSTVRL